MGTGFPLRWGTLARAGDQGQAQRDVQFISDLIDKLAGEYNIDKDRIYANGLSNGGGMSFLLACQMADRIAAIGGVAGAYSTSWSECSPSRPVPVIAFHGDADPVVPYEGGIRTSRDYDFPAISDWIAAWAKNNACNLTSEEGPTSGEVSSIRYTGCAENANVELFTIHGGGHSWPGGDNLPKFIVGETTQDIDATRVMWDFFQEHPLQAQVN
jgi:polyhydroxybutyrate depolymerase